jgi:hypothetical protein
MAIQPVSGPAVGDSPAQLEHGDKADGKSEGQEKLVVTNTTEAPHKRWDSRWILLIQLE